MLFVFFKLIDFNTIIGISDIIGLEVIYQLIVIFSSIFVILFLPFYPIFFIILKRQVFTVLEKLGLTIVVNSAFFIFLGYFGYWVGISISGFLFFFGTMIPFLIIICYIVFFEFKKETYVFFKPIYHLIDNSEKLDKFSLFKYLKNKITLNSLLLVVFLSLICILNITKFSIFLGTDPWLHILNSRIITEENILPLKGYHGTMGISIFGAVINFFSGVSHILIPKYFLIYTFFLSAILFYSISLRIFKRKNLSLFSVFIIEFSSLGFSNMMLQYWPSGSALIKCLAIFLLLYIRLQKFIQLERPTKREIISNVFLIYILTLMVFVSSVLTHVITSIIFLFSFLWLYLIYFLKDYRRGIDFIFLCSLMGIFLILNIFGIGSGHYWFFIPLNFSWYFLLLIGGGGILAGGILLWKLQKSIKFNKSRFKSAILGKKNKYFKKIEDKVIIPLIFSILIVITISLLIVNLIWIEIEITNIFYISEIILLSAFAIWGLIVYQKKPRGKPLFIWGIGLFILLGIGFVFNILILSNMIWQRILYLIPPIIVIGFISYIYKIIKLKKIETIRMKFIIFFIIVFSLLTTYFYESVSFEVFTLRRRDISPIQWYSNNTSDKNVLITEFGWTNVFKYYSYTHNNINVTPPYEGNVYNLKYEIDLFPPENHFDENGTNILKQVKEDYNTDVYIMFSDTYIINKGFELFGKLSQDELETYYSLDYLDKICSSKIEEGGETPIFWVI
ncbi:MAG: hypothetical protein ACFE94_14300 [Candidatus Hodarchaeota archaeon]